MSTSNTYPDNWNRPILPRPGPGQRMSILGAVTLGDSFRLAVDVNTGQTVNDEILLFEAGGAALAGTLAVTMVNFVDPPAQIRVVSMFNGTGQVDTVTGAQAFDVQQEASGVLLIRN